MRPVRSELSFVAALLAFLACCLAPGHGAKDASPAASVFRDANFGVSLSLAPGWARRAGKPQEGTLAVFTRNLGSGKTLHLSVMAGAIPIKGVDVHGYVDQTLSFTKKAVSGVEVVKNERLEVGGLDAHEVVLRYEVSQGGAKVRVKALQLFIVARGNAYNVTAKAKEKEFDGNFEELQRIVRSTRVDVKR